MRSIRHGLAAAALVAGCSAEPPAPAAPATTGPFAPVAFLVGDWEGTSADGAFDEHWIAPKGGVMLGVGREVAAGATSFFELLRIEARPSGLVLVPHPFGKPAGEFPLASASAEGVVFENTGDDRVARIAYRPRGDELVVEVVFREGGRVETFRMRRAQAR